MIRTLNDLHETALKHFDEVGRNTGLVEPCYSVVVRADKTVFLQSVAFDGRGGGFTSHTVEIDLSLCTNELLIWILSNHHQQTPQEAEIEKLNREFKIDPPNGYGNDVCN